MCIQEEYQALLEQKNKYYKDNIDTNNAINNIRILISGTFSYIKDASDDEASSELLLAVGGYVNSILTVFGLENFGWYGFTSGYDEYKNAFQATSNELTQQQIEDSVYPFVQLLSEFRQKVRIHAKANKDLDLLGYCDDIRDKILPKLGVRIEDKDGTNKFSVIKFVSTDDIATAAVNPLDTKVDQTASKNNEKDLLSKEAHAKKLEDRKLEKDMKASIDPKTMFLKETDKYSKFDEMGIPTHDANGESLSKTAQKKLKKAYALQEKLYQSHISSKN